MSSSDFKHLTISYAISGKPRLRGMIPPTQRTLENKRQRVSHGNYLKGKSHEVSRFWTDRSRQRLENGLPDIKTGVPILLEIDPQANIDFLRGLGFEIIVELDEGYIIVATDDFNLEKFNEKIDGFINNVNTRCNTPAKIYELCNDDDRLKRILSPSLYEKWHTIEPSEYYFIDICISCSDGIKLPELIDKEDSESVTSYEHRKERWTRRYAEAYQKWDDCKYDREQALIELVSFYNGEIVGSFVDGNITDCFSTLPDSFSARLRVNGDCIRDLALNYAYVFSLSLSEKISVSGSPNNTDQYEISVEIEQPTTDSSIVSILDSGVQEEHQYLAPAIINGESYSLLPNDTSTSDEVLESGHGTRVAGAILYPDNVPTNGSYQLPCWIRNIRILDSNNFIPENLYPPLIIKKVINKNNELSRPSKIFNHSVGSNSTCELIHMSPWAAEIDNQSYNSDILFIQAAGNIQKEIIKAYSRAGHYYPHYLYRDLSRICNPAQSLQAITVGSVTFSSYETEDYIALGDIEHPSSFSRSGPGIWDVIKPEVVEYGGTDVSNKEGEYQTLTNPKEVCPQLIRRSPQGPAFAQDEVGTSFTAPKVASIAARLENLLPNAPSLLYRALIAQSARWPEWTHDINEEDYCKVLRAIGYGIPNAQRATENSEHRITLITEGIQEIGVGEAHVYKVPIPDEINQIGDDYNILVEVTLSYAAKPRHTRRYIKRYLSTWVDWCCSKIGESSETFCRRIFETGSAIDDDGNFKWFIGEAINQGLSDNFSRKKGTLQKDWTIVESNQLSDAFCIAVRGHKGWGQAFKAKYSLAVSFEALNEDISLYSPIRSLVELEMESSQIEVEVTSNSI